LRVAFRANPFARLTFSGHTDRSGSTSTNRRTVLSRAETIRGELENRGIPRNAMSVVSFGEGQPLVPTEDGLREVLNRRVATNSESEHA
jgi:outer membrane protein OmpA-like peptidoglycan-associated protein